MIKSVCSGWTLHPDSVMLQSGLMLLHQILNPISASFAFVTCLFPAPEEPLKKFKAAAGSSMRRTPLPYDLSAFQAAGERQFSCCEIWGWSTNNCPEGVPDRRRMHKRSEEQGSNSPIMQKPRYRDEDAAPDLQAPVNVEQLNPHGTFREWHVLALKLPWRAN